MEDISIVIPTHNRISECEELFKSLGRAIEFAEAACEVIVVDDSNPQNANAIQQLCSDYGFEYLPSSTRNISAKRNLGWKTAKNEIVLFLDSDCIVEHALVTQHLQTYQVNNVIGCLGDLVFDGPKTIFFRATEITPFAWPFRFARRFKETTWGSTANISFRKSELERVGGFDTTFPDRPGGEDVDLGLRMTRNSHLIQCNAEARVFHTTATWNSFKSNVKRFYQWGKADYHLIIRHPERASIDLPRIPLIFGLLFIFSLFISIAKGTTHFFALPFFWMLLTIAFSIAFFHCEFRKSSVLERFFALIYLFSNEVGTLLEGLKKRHWPIVIKRMIYGPDQIYGEWHEAGKRLWAQWIALMICFALY